MDSKNRAWGAPRGSFARAPTGFRRLTPGLLKADRMAEEKQRDEYKERWTRADKLYKQGSGSYEDMTAAKLAYEYHYFETIHKQEDLKVASNELRQAQTARSAAASSSASKTTPRRVAANTAKIRSTTSTPAPSCKARHAAAMSSLS